MAPSADDNDMHRRVEWMVSADVSILEFLDAARDAFGNPSIQTPQTIAINTHYSRQHIGNRCQTLADHGLVERVDKGQYRLSDRGQSLMDGGISPTELSEDADAGSDSE